MYDSNSFIAESISNQIKRSQHPQNSQPPAEMLRSQTHPYRPSSNAISRPSKQNILRSIAQQQQSKMSPSRNQLSPPKPQYETPSQQFQKTEPQPFLKYYEQNLQLKKKQEQMVREIKILKHKIQEKDNSARVFLEQELKGLATGKKSQWDRKHPQSAVGRGKSTNNKNLKTNKVEHLLEIIEHYKTKLITAEEEISNLKRQKFLLEQDNKIKDKRYSALTEDKPEMNTFNEEMNLADKLKRNIRELELEKEKNKSYELAIKGLEAKLRAGETKIQQIDVLRSENRTLEEQLLRLSSLPNFNNVIDRAEEEKNMRQVENKLKLTNEKYNKLEQRFIKTDADVKILQNRLIEAEYINNTLEEETKQLKKQSINNHILLRLNNEPELLQEVFFEIQKRKTRKDKQKQPENAKTRIEKLILEKEQLAKQLINYQVRVQTLEETARERERLGQLQKEQPVSNIPQTKTTGKQGVLYEGDASCFSQQNTNIPLGSNYFDLFLGEVTLLESAVSSVTGLSNASNPLILATVDFYNHNTQSSKLTQGCRCNLQSQFFFKVTEDDFFFKFLQKGTLKIEIWASEGSKHHNLGKATIDLKHLLARAKPRISPIIQSSATLHLGSRVLGSINFSMRMRMPIYDQAQRVREGTGSVFENKEETAIRRLVIQIDEGRGFGDKSNTFVYYPFRLEDHYTRTARGNNPAWNHIKMLQIPYDNDFKNYLRKGELEFIIFDDNAVSADDRNLDVGSASLSLASLLEGKQIKERLQIKKGSQRRGTIDVKIFWYEADESSDILNLGSTKQLGPEAVHEQLRTFMKEYNVDAEKVFRLIDDNRTGVISYEQFQDWLFKNSAKKFTGQAVSAYYKGFKEPVNHKNFIARVEKEYNQIVAAKKEAEGVAAGIGFINEMLKLNSTQIKTITLEEFLQGKNLVQVVQSIETDRQGYVTKQQLQTYLDKHGIDAQIPNDRVKLIDFLRKHQKVRLSLNL